MFEPILQDLGTINHKEEYTIVFNYSDIYMIKRVQSSCDCSRAYNKATERKIIVKYQPKPIPKHLKDKGKTFLNIVKNITVTYQRVQEDETENIIVLTFKAKVI